MKKEIITKSLLVAFIALLISGIISAAILENQYNSSKRDEMVELLNTMSTINRGNEDYTSFAKRLSSMTTDKMRVTLIERDGKVLGDNEANAATMENHSNRPEVKAALQTGYGTSERKSKTLGRSLLYAAKRLPDGTILRLAVSLSQLYDHLWTLLPALLIGTLLALLITPLLMARLLGGIIRPFSDVADTLQSINNGSYGLAIQESSYSELQPIVSEINALSYTIAQTLRDLTSERKRVDFLLNNMNEGLIVLDSSLRILTINSSALSFFGASGDMKGQNLLHLIHLPKIIEAATLACENGEHSFFDLPTADGKILQIFFNPVLHDIHFYDDEEEHGGAIMLVTDVTTVRKTDQIRSDFVANASHELKTPLTSIKGFAELMESGIITDPEKVAKYLKIIRTETERMIELINDILKISELESISADNMRAHVSIRSIAQKVADSLALYSSEKNVSIQVTGDVGTYEANPDRITQLLLNLIDNAIKYNVDGGKVDINVSERIDGVTVRVSDTGIGIPPEAQSRIFERFYRVDKSRSRKMGGTGLGLSIVKHIVSLYKGTIRLESKVGEGTSIEIFLPSEANDVLNR